jgi:hypothetical protein
MGMDVSAQSLSAPAPSQQLIVANRRLYELRKQAVASCQRSAVNIQYPTAAARRPGDAQYESASGAPAMDRRSHRAPVSGNQPAAQSPADNLQSPTSNHIKLYPDLALGMLRKELASPGRIWLLLKHIDRNGRGWLSLDIIQRELSDKQSPLRVCGWRQLRNLLGQGRGIFWERTRERRPDRGTSSCHEHRIWIKSAAKVALALDVKRLSGSPVSLPVAALLGGMGQVRAHFYSSFHSGRAKGDKFKNSAMPIARNTLETLSGVSRRSQQIYEGRAGVGVKSNYAIGERVGTNVIQERAWQQGQALFHLVDHQGRQGHRGGRYMAWQLPNNYSGVHEQRPKGRQKRINGQLADLFMKGITGNGKSADATNHRSRPGHKFQRRYYASGALAAAGYQRDPDRDAYWPDSASNDSHPWQVIPARNR